MRPRGLSGKQSEETAILVKGCLSDSNVRPGVESMHQCVVICMICFSIVVVKYHSQEELTEEPILAFGSRRKEVVHNDGEGMPTRDHSRKLGAHIFKHTHKAEVGFLISQTGPPAENQVCKYRGPWGGG